MPIAKALGGGFPVGACLATARAASGMTAGTHGSTFGGNPLACAVANAVLDVMLEEGFLEGVRERGAQLIGGLEELRRRYPAAIAEVRGRGLMAGIRTEAPNSDWARRLHDHGVVPVTASDNVVRLLPPLTVDRGGHRVRAATRLEAVCREMAG